MGLSSRVRKRSSWSHYIASTKVQSSSAHLILRYKRLKLVFTLQWTLESEFCLPPRDFSLEPFFYYRDDPLKDPKSTGFAAR